MKNDIFPKFHNYELNTPQTSNLIEKNEANNSTFKAYNNNNIKKEGNYFNFNLKTLPTDSIEDLTKISRQNLNSTFGNQNEESNKLKSSPYSSNYRNNENNSYIANPNTQILINQNYNFSNKNYEDNPHNIDTNSIEFSPGNRYKTTNTINTDEIMMTSMNKFQDNEIVHEKSKISTLLEDTNKKLKNLGDYKSRYNYNKVSNENLESNHNFNAPSVTDMISPKSCTSNDTNIMQYNKDLIDYRITIEKMQNEIKYLNTKIYDIEKKNVKINFNPNESKSEFTEDKENSKTKFIEKYKENTEKVDKNNYILEKIVIDGDNNITTHPISIKKSVSKNKTEYNKRMNPKQETRSNVSKASKRSNSESKLSRMNKDQDKKIPNNYKKNSKEGIKSKISKETKTNKINNQDTNHENLILKEENAFLKRKIQEMNENKKNEIVNSNLTYNQEISNHDLIWKQRAESLGTKYLSVIESLKNQISYEKKFFTDQIKNLHNECIGQVRSLNEKYINTVKSLESSNSLLKKENEDLKKRFNKVKQVLSNSKE